MTKSRSFIQMRSRNSDQVIGLVRDIPGISRAELAKQAGLAKATVSAIVDDLLSSRVLAEVGTKPSSGGRPGVGLTFNASFGYVLGVGLDETEITACFLDLNGKIIKQIALAVELNWTAQATWTQLEEELDRSIAELGLTRKKVLALGAAIPGPIEFSADGEPLVQNVYGDLLKLLKKHFKCPLTIDSNLNMAALAELGISRTNINEVVLVVRLGHMVRAALLVNGNIVSGSGGLAGEIGHIRMPDLNLPCSCGAVGCINTVAGFGAILERLRRAGIAINNFDELHQMNSDLQKAEEILHEAGAAAGHGIAIALNLIAPHALVIAGPATAAGDLLLAPLKEALAREGLKETMKSCRISTGIAGHMAESVGAGSQALQQFCQTLGMLVTAD